jgi:TPR repeat protein
VSKKNKGPKFETDNDNDLGDIESFKMLADKGDPDGLYALGAAYIFGMDIEQDDVKGIKLLEAASEKGHALAMTLLLQLNMEGAYSMDTQRSIEYAKKGAEAGMCVAQLNLGTAYLDGVGVEQNYAKAAELFRLSAKQGNTEARNSLAYIYQEGLGVEKDEIKAFKLYKNAAAAGNMNAQFQTGAYYESGIGVRMDWKKAAEWYSKAAEQDDSYAMERLGIMYYVGSSVLPQDPEQSFNWFLKAAMDGMLGSMYFVGVFYFLGFGVEKDKVDGMKWLKLAVSCGNEEARELIAKIEETGAVPDDW